MFLVVFGVVILVKCPG